MYILSQVFVVCSEIFFGLTYLTKKKPLLLVFNIINNLFFGVHYLLLNSFTAAYAVFLTIIFLIVVYIIEHFKKEKFTFIVSIICSLILIPITIFTWNNALSLLPAFAILAMFIGSVFKNLIAVKLLYFTNAVLNTIFMFIITSYFGVALNCIVLIIGIIGIIKQIKLQKNLAKS